jgi:hypothetical protein
MNIQHTSGPWLADYSTRNYWFIEYRQGGEDYTLTKLDCGAADARLIAAAPDLLAALRIAEDALDMYSGGQSSDLAAIRAAIDKAMGAA